jgi:hypothetical protein
MSEIKAINTGNQTIPTVDRELRESINLDSKATKLAELSIKIVGGEN